MKTPKLSNTNFNPDLFKTHKSSNTNFKTPKFRIRVFLFSSTQISLSLSLYCKGKLFCFSFFLISLNFAKFTLRWNFVLLHVSDFTFLLWNSCFQVRSAFRLVQPRLFDFRENRGKIMEHEILNLYGLSMLDLWDLNETMWFCSLDDLSYAGITWIKVIISCCYLNVWILAENSNDAR